MEALILPLILVAMFALVIMPQRRQQKQQAALLSSLGEGDAVLTSGGIYGVITEVDGNDVFLEVAKGIELRVNKSAVLRKVGDPNESTEGK
jgi:preprotein translocase subunit YajC